MICATYLRSLPKIGIAYLLDIVKIACEISRSQFSILLKSHEKYLVLNFYNGFLRDFKRAGST